MAENGPPESAPASPASPAPPASVTAPAGPREGGDNGLGSNSDSYPGFLRAPYLVPPRLVTMAITPGVVVGYFIGIWVSLLVGLTFTILASCVVIYLLQQGVRAGRIRAVQPGEKRSAGSRQFLRLAGVGFLILLVAILYGLSLPFWAPKEDIFFISFLALIIGGLAVSLYGLGRWFWLDARQFPLFGR